jgi:hypothetical protein
MITQERFVTACQKYYARNGLEPGNPLHGEWHKAHYPVPRCLGGTEWVWLLIHHHALQGVIQSEEMGCCCLYTWERKYLPARYLTLYRKWRTEHGRRSAKLVAEKYSWSQWQRDSWQRMTPEQRKNRLRGVTSPQAIERAKKNLALVRERCRKKVKLTVNKTVYHCDSVKSAITILRDNNIRTSPNVVYDVLKQRIQRNDFSIVYE